MIRVACSCSLPAVSNKAQISASLVNRVSCSGRCVEAVVTGVLAFGGVLGVLGGEGVGGEGGGDGGYGVNPLR